MLFSSALHQVLRIRGAHHQCQGPTNGHRHIDGSLGEAVFETKPSSFDFLTARNENKIHDLNDFLEHDKKFDMTFVYFCFKTILKSVFLKTLFSVF